MFCQRTLFSAVATSVFNRASLHGEVATALAALKVPHPLFRAWSIREGVFGIEERFFESWNKANIFYVVGRDRDLLVDTGIGIHSLPRFLSFLGFGPFTSTKKPLSVVLTHCHFDHSGGLHQFAASHDNNSSSRADDLCVHEAEAKYLTNGDQYMAASWVTQDEILPKPRKDWKAREYRVEKVSTLRSLKDGDVFDLGDWKFEVLHFPGHSPGSIGLHDKDRGVLVSGDTLYQTDYELVDWYPRSSVLGMRRSVERIRALAESGQVDLVLPGHNKELTSREDILRAADRHLAMTSSYGRVVSKVWSRLRAGCLIRANRVIPVPNVLRELMMS